MKIVFKSVLLLLFLSLSILVPEVDAQENHEVGDTKLFWAYGQGFFSGYYQLSATCHKVGDHIYIFTEDARVNEVHVSSLDPNIFWVATESGVFVSEDMGQTWVPKSNEFPTQPTTGAGAEDRHLDQAFSIIVQADKGDIYAGTANGIYRSKDNGDSWSSVPLTGPDYQPSINRILDDPFESRQRGFFVTTEDGIFWNRGRGFINIGNGLPFSSAAEDGGTGPVHDIIALNDSTNIIATSNGIFNGGFDRKDNQGQTDWHPLEPIGVTASELESDTTAYKRFQIEAQADDGKSLSGSDWIFAYDQELNARWGQLLRQDIDNGYFFIELSEDNLYFDGMIEDPEEFDFSTLQTDDLEFFIASANEYRELAVDENDVIFAAGTSGIMKIENFGQTINGFGLDTLVINDIFLDTTSSVIYAATGVGLFKSSTSTPAWEKISTTLTDVHGREELDLDVRSVTMDTTGALLIGSHYGGFLRSTDGQNWRTQNKALINRSLDLSVIDTMYHSFEIATPVNENQGIYDQLTDVFGEPTDIDDNEMIYILVFDLIDQYYEAAGNQGGGYLDGFIDPINLLPKEENPNSNQMELLYIDNDPLPLKENEESAVLAKYFTKLLIETLDKDEDRFFKEGTADLAAFITGYGDTSKVYKVNSNNSISVWGDITNSEEHNDVFVFFEYMYEHYFSDPADFKVLIQDTLNGMDGFNSALSKIGAGKTMEEIFDDFAMAVYFDNADPAFNEGRYGFENLKVEAKTLLLDWGKTVSPPYFYRQDEWSIFYIAQKGLSAGVNFSPNFDEVYVFNGEDQSTFSLRFIEQVDDAKTPDAKITMMIPDEYNKAQYTPDFGKLNSTYQYSMLVSVCTEGGAAPNQGAFMISNDIVQPEITGMTFGQNPAFPEFVDFYFYTNERIFRDGGNAINIVAGDEGPLFTISTADTTIERALTGFYSAPDLYLYRLLFSIDELGLSDGQTVDISATGEDASGNKVNSQIQVMNKRIYAETGAILNKAGWDLTVSVPERAVEKDISVVMAQVQPQAKFEELVPVTSAYQIGPSGVRTTEPMLLTFDFESASFTGEEIEKISVHRFEDGEWVSLGARIDVEKGQIYLNTDLFGQYQVFKTENLSSNTEVIPETFALDQNYPNPFNPSTTIRYQLPLDQNIDITVFNILGQKVKTLYNGFKSAGTYEIKWNGLNEFGEKVSSGVYFYHLKAQGFSDVKKMILLY